MKKLTFAIILMGAGLTFANAQTTETMKQERAETATTTAAEMKADTTVMPPAENQNKAETMKSDQPMTTESIQVEEAARDAEKAAYEAGQANKVDMTAKEKKEMKRKSKK